ncbi:MAG: hypothetical protein ACAH88_08285 [Roseimicrobium sp.]
MKWLLWILIPCALITAVVTAGMVELDLGPRPEIRVVQTLIRGTQQSYLLEVVNPTQQDLEFWGYGAANPMYQMKTLESGEWKDAMLGWCGMGAAPQRLPAQGSQRFEVYVRDAPARVGLLLLPTNYNRGQVHQFQWLPFALRVKLVKWQNQRLDDKTQKKMVWSEPLEPLPGFNILSASTENQPGQTTGL